MPYQISKTFEFAASHYLSGLPDGHKCARLHGHNYKVTLHLKSDKLDENGFVRDYGELAIFKQMLDKVFDHRHLNDVLMCNPTAENLAREFYYRAQGCEITECYSVTVQETDKTYATYTP